MLKLTRKKSQSVAITHAGERLDIIIASARGQVQLGFEGPTSFHVLRTEVANAIRNSAHSEPTDGEALK